MTNIDVTVAAREIALKEVLNVGLRDDWPRDPETENEDAACAAYRSGAMDETGIVRVAKDAFTQATAQQAAEIAELRALLVEIRNFRLAWDRLPSSIADRVKSALAREGEG